MSMINLFEDDLLNLLFTNCTSTERCFPFNATEPRWIDALVGTVIIMVPIVPTAYYFWRWMGWV